MAQYISYPSYKSSNSNFIGDIPTQWDVKRFKFLISSPLKYGSNESAELSDSELPRYIRITDVKEDGSLREDTFRSLPEAIAEPYLLEEGDILLARSGATVGKTFIYRKKWGIAAYAGYLIRARTAKGVLDADFAYYFLQSSVYWHWLNSIFIQATIQNVSAEKYANLFIPLPEYFEQQTIARFLDFKTAQIDVLIAKQQSLLDKLAEKRTALISHAVTKGLDPSVPMKDSGVAWLGKVPEHWRLLQLKYAVMFQRGHDLPANARTEGAIPLVSSSGISSSHDVAIAKGPGIVTGRYGTIGKFTYVESDYWPLNTTLYSIDTHGNNTKYLWFMMHLLSDLFVMESKKGAVPGVDRNDLHSVLTVIPPQVEQDVIVAHLEKTMLNLDKQVKKIAEVIERLQEYRSTLITNTVTGKIDVCGIHISQSQKNM